ncbi:MAG: hypothetical protein HND43_10635 [Armatimonadetes bacterium]|nr:hypothetical protein [Armatimonadota bacterium]NOG39830.1 hypothetical protein [Armatimonadota bacterium]GIK67606.1 MAG: hypothetical protein BroJett018_54000 [Chloroflexota bacterium]
MMVKQFSPEFLTALEMGLQLSPRERMAMIEELAASFRDESAWEVVTSDEPPMDDEEIAALMQIEPLPPAEVIALGLLGAWADMEIEDGAEWVNGQKRRKITLYKN